MKFYIKKLFDFLITLLLVTFLTFIAFSVIPENPAVAILGPDADEVQIQQLEKEFDLNKPLYIRYAKWLSNAARGNFGISYKFNRSVKSIISDAAQVTLSLAAFTILLTAAIGLPLGICFAYFSKNPFVGFCEILNQVWISTPSFCAAILLILVFAVMLPLFPSMGFVPWRENPSACIRTLFLPALSLSLGSSAILARYVNVSFSEQKNKDYVKTALSKGLSPFYTCMNHIFRNSLISIVTVFGMIFAEILGGSIIIENVFSLPGIGKLIVSSISSRDFPLIQGLSLYLAFITMVCNFSTDILYGIIDPRIIREKRRLKPAFRAVLFRRKK